MDRDSFAKSYTQLQELGRAADAAWRDLGIFSDYGTYKGDLGERRREVLTQMQDILVEDILTKAPLTSEQAEALGNITFGTPYWEGALDCNVHRFSLMRPCSGVFANFEEMPGDVKMVMALMGAKSYRIQGVRTGYIPFNVKEEN